MDKFKEEWLSMEVAILSLAIVFMFGMFAGERSRTTYYKTLVRSYIEKIENTEDLSNSSKQIAIGVLTELEKVK